MTWTTLGDVTTIPCCYAPIDFPSELHGWRSGVEVQRTDDGGATWTTVDAAIPPGLGGTSALRFATTDDGLWTGNGAGGVTHDGGATREPVIVVPFREGTFAPSDIAVIDVPYTAREARELAAANAR